MTKAQDKQYSVYINGFDEPYSCVAASASKARYRAYVAYREAGYGRHWHKTETFRDFLHRISRTLHFGVGRGRSPPSASLPNEP